jgi:hypothetical protein
MKITFTAALIHFRGRNIIMSLKDEVYMPA